MEITTPTPLFDNHHDVVPQFIDGRGGGTAAESTIWEYNADGIAYDESGYLYDGEQASGATDGGPRLNNIERESPC